MTKTRTIHSLRYRMLIALGISLAIAVGVYLLLNTVSNYLIYRYYLSESAIAARTEDYATRLEKYVTDNHVYSTDIAALQRWVRQNPYAYMLVYNGTEMVWDSGWWDDSFATALEELASSVPLPAEEYDGVSFSAVSPTYYDTLYEIVFMDGPFQVAVTDYSDERVFNVVRAMVTLFSVFLVFPIVLWYARNISRRVICLTREVDKISSGELNGPITIAGQDEIAELSNGVNLMRLSVIEQLEKEQIAWRANSDLITSMSHDIRTPLTVLLGYTSLLKNKQYASPEEFDSYVDVIEKKSLQLKELSDKLFRYFLVFGNAAPPKLELVTAKALFLSLIGEHTVLLTDSGFQFNLTPLAEDCTLLLDLSYTKRIFDNLFKNIEKYADPAIPCDISLSFTGERLLISLQNSVSKTQNEIETTNIGLKTCARMAIGMNGRFHTERADDSFRAILELPATKV